MIRELDNEYQIRVDSSAKQIREALALWQKDGGPGIFNIIKMKRVVNGKTSPYTLKELELLLESPTVKKKLGLSGDYTDVVTSFWNGVISDKEEFKKQQSTKKKGQVFEERNPDYSTFGSSMPVELFTDITLIKPNVADEEFFENFRTNGENLLYRDKSGRVHVLFMNERGKLDLQNDLDSGDDSVWTHICMDLGMKWKKYVDLYKMFLINERDSDDKFYEQPMMEGMTDPACPDDTFFVPTVFRYLIQPVVKRDKEGFVSDILCRGKAMKTLAFDDAMDALCSNWANWTKGYIKKLEGWKSFANRPDAWAVNVYELPQDWKSAQLPESWKKFFAGKAEGRILQRVFYYIGSCLDSSNTAQQALIIADKGGTGKSEFVRLLKKILPEGMCGSLENDAMTNTRFSIYSYGLYKHHILFDEEYDGSSATGEFFKKLIGGNSFNCEIKGGKSFTWNAEGTKVIMTSNKICYTKEHAIRRRIIPVSFRSNFDPTSGMDGEFKKQLIADGDAFLKFCFKVYRTCKLRTCDGGYVVMNPEQEERMKTEKVLLTNDIYPTWLMKAFSEDPAVKEYFRCGDWSTETHYNDDFIDIYNILFEYSSDSEDFIKVTELKERIAECVWKSSIANRESFMDTFDWSREYDRDGKVVREFLSSMNSAKNSRFVKFLEDTQGHVYGKVKKDKALGKTVRVVTNIKLRKDWNVIEI